MYQGRDIYEYVKFALYLQDSYDESFVFFGNYGPNSRNIWSSTPRLLWEQQYYLLGNISLLCTPDESVEIVDVQPATWLGPFELVPVSPSSHSSISRDRSATTSVSPCVRTSSSDSATDITSTTPVSTPGQGCVIDPKYMLEPQDMEFEVGPEFLLNDSQEEQASLEQGECTEEDVTKPWEEAKVSNPKEHVIDEDSAHQDASSDDDSCIIIEDTEDKKDPKTQEVIKIKEQGDQQAPEAVLPRPTTPLRPVRPEAVVEPMPRRTYQFHRPLLGERFAQLCGPRVMTQVYDLSISRSFHDELPSYTDIEEEDREQEQLEYELAQRIELLRNLPYERPGQQQTGQGQGPRVYRPREQMVTVIDDVGPRAMNFFQNDNSEHSQNEMHRRWEDPVDSAPPLLHHSRSWQEMITSHQASAASQYPSAASHQTLAAPCQVSLPSCQVSTVSHPPWTTSYQLSVSQQVSAAAYHPSAMSHNASSDHRRESRQRFLPPGQDQAAYFQAEEDANPHP
ncbi:uncharacterized protein LOC110314339 [Mus pahari]|uniref:uncharacterized protein LOC110314339 n=1 Tax=Mus pahari TaxID=10093 RepID=UPI000A313B50|nr:uncharacterized protein LOC110314339 [Mus pahari]